MVHGPSKFTALSYLTGPSKFTLHIFTFSHTDGPNDEKSITVLNANNDKTPDGPLEVVSGFAYLTDTVGKLVVTLGRVNSTDSQRDDPPPLGAPCKTSLLLFSPV